MKGSKERQAKAANTMLRDTLNPDAAVPDSSNAPDPGDGGPLPGECKEPADTQGAPVFTPVAPEKMRVGGWAFHKLGVGESIAFTVEKLVTEADAEASPDGKPLFHGIYAREWGTGRYVILNAHFQLWAFLEDEGPDEWEAKIYRATVTAERPAKGGRTVFEYAIQEALRP